MRRVKRSRYVPLIETVETEDGTVNMAIEGGLEAAMQEAASCVQMLDRLGGNLVIPTDQEQIESLGGDHQFQTRGFVFRHDSQMPPRRPPRPEPVEEPAEEPEAEPLEG